MTNFKIRNINILDWLFDIWILEFIWELVLGI